MQISLGLQPSVAPAMQDRRPRVFEGEYEIYDAADVRAVMDVCPSSPTGARDAALINLMWCSGIRCAELCDIKLEFVNRRNGTLWVECGKGGKSRLVVLPKGMRPELWKRIDRWLKHRKNHAWVDSPLFCSLQGSRLDESYVRRMFVDRAGACGLGRRFHPHGLRHTFAAKMHLAGVPLDVIQKQLGHADVSVTGRYLRKIAAKTVRERFDDFSVE